MNFEFNPASIEYATSGFEHIGRKFFLFIPLEPPRAGIIANISKTSVPPRFLLQTLVY